MLRSGRGYSARLADGVTPSAAFSAVASGARETISAGIMFAVIRTGGKQYKVAKDDVVAVEKLAGEPGAAIELAEVLMIGEGAEVATGTPLLEGASVAATVVEQKRAPKIIVFKKQRRKNYRRKKGHRQYQTVLRIDEIRGAVGSLPAEGERPDIDVEPAAEAGPVIEAGPAVEAEPATEAEPAVEAGRAGGEGASNGA
jgi:large subunit ribosomal protein L21